MEVAGMRRSELDLDNGRWNLPGTRTKNGKAHIVYLSKQVTEIIEQLPRLDGDLVFSTTGKTAVSGFSNAKKVVDATMREQLAKLDRGLEHCAARWSPG
jgi:integrase